MDISFGKSNAVLRAFYFLKFKNTLRTYLFLHLKEYLKKELNFFKSLLKELC